MLGRLRLGVRCRGRPALWAWVSRHVPPCVVPEPRLSCPPAASFPPLPLPLCGLSVSLKPRLHEPRQLRPSLEGASWLVLTLRIFRNLGLSSVFHACLCFVSVCRTEAPAAATVTLTLFSCPAGLEDRPSSGSWGTGDQNSSSFDPSRAYGEGTHFPEPHDSLSPSTFLGPGLTGKGSERSAYAAFGRDAGVGGLSQAGFLPSELALSSPGPLSPSGTKGGSQYYSYAGHPRRRAAESGLDTQPKKVRKVPPGLPSSVYPSSSGDDYGRDTAAYPPAKTPGGTYPTPFYTAGMWGLA
uniref:transcription factor E2-alpha-like n=1 Tax=Panthera onca TaxID=9690 RepID=UPI0029548C86|nr:transcription factor E2-alpha-like [Panthera onca]